MNAPFQHRFSFEAVENGVPDGEVLLLDLDGYEGPLHILLALAQRQKVDLLKLSVAKLADQYLAFVRQARRRRFALAADYLVMAAWLAYLKSRLLLPRPASIAGEEPPAETVAAYLAFRLAKLDAMRRAYEGFEARAVLGRDVFTRGDPQATVVVSHDRLEGDIHELMDAYVSQRRRADDRRYAPRPATCYRLDDARHHLNDILPELGDWTPLAKVTLRPGGQGDEPSAASFLASTLSATLEMVREGALETRQLKPFSDVYLRAVAA